MATATSARRRVGAGWERNAPLIGVLAVVLWVIGIIVESTAAGKSKGPAILAQYKNNDGKILLGAIIWLIGVGAFLWFVGILRERIAVAEGGNGRLASIAFGGGVAAATAGALLPAGDVAGALGKDDIDASAAAALHHIDDGFFVATEYLLPVLLIAAALAALRYGILPRWFAWLSLLVALVLLIGPIGWAALLFGTPIWTLIASFFLFRSSVTSTPAAAATAP